MLMQLLLCDMEGCDAEARIHTPSRIGPIMAEGWSRHPPYIYKQRDQRPGKKVLHFCPACTKRRQENE